jgi:hypothetical protein
MILAEHSRICITASLEHSGCWPQETLTFVERGIRASSVKYRNPLFEAVRIIFGFKLQCRHSMWEKDLARLIAGMASIALKTWYRYI